MSGNSSSNRDEEAGESFIRFQPHQVAAGCSRAELCQVSFQHAQVGRRARPSLAVLGSRGAVGPCRARGQVLAGARSVPERGQGWEQPPERGHPWEAQ